MDAHVLKRCSLEMERDAASLAAALKHEAIGAVGSLCWTRFQSQWVYMLPFAVGGKTTALPQVPAFAVAVHSKQFDPEKHGAICAELAKAYATAGTPLKVLEGYLSIMTLSVFGSFQEKQYDAGKAKKGAAPLGWVLNVFGVEVVLLWTAMLLKKRIVVYSNKVVGRNPKNCTTLTPSPLPPPHTPYTRLARPLCSILTWLHTCARGQVSEVQSLLRALPALVWHRDNWNLLRPYCLLDDQDENDWQGIVSNPKASPFKHPNPNPQPTNPQPYTPSPSTPDPLHTPPQTQISRPSTRDPQPAPGVFCAGVTQPLQDRGDIWKLYVDIPAASISVAEAVRKVTTSPPLTPHTPHTTNHIPKA